MCKGWKNKPGKESGMFYAKNNRKRKNCDEQEGNNDAKVIKWANQRHTSHGPIKTQPFGTEQQPQVECVHVSVVDHLKTKPAMRQTTSPVDYLSIQQTLD